MKIETERLILREFHKSDLDSVYEYISDPQASMYMTWQDRMTKKDTARFIQMSISYHEKKPRKNYELAITFKGEKQLIGGCGIRVQSIHHKKADIGYIINRKYWGHGYATEAAWALVRFGFDKLMLHRIFATCDVKNSASIRVLEKIGMTREGLFREDFFIHGRWRSSYMYSILQKEYQSIK
jgi:RimJ/RimL family protein N-acetyltransferase